MDGTGKNEKLVPVSEAYEQDFVCINIPGIEAGLVDKRSHIRKSQASDEHAEGSRSGNTTISTDEEVSKMVNYMDIKKCS